MAKHLSRANIVAIVNCIRGMRPNEITWDRLCDRVAPLIGKRPSRQSLCKHPQIASAYRAKKDSLGYAGPVVSKPSSLSIAGQQIDRMRLEIAELKAQNSKLLELFMILQYNAHCLGVTEVQLYRPLPPANRERTDGA